MSETVSKLENGDKADKADKLNKADIALIDRKKHQEEFIETVECNLKRSEKDIWFLRNEDHPQKESLTSSLTKSAHK